MQIIMMHGCSTNCIMQSIIMHYKYFYIKPNRKYKKISSFILVAFKNTLNESGQNFLNKMKNSNITSCYTDFEIGIPELLGVIISVLNITFVNLSLYAIIWKNM